jgi:hypothetical protein
MILRMRARGPRTWAAALAALVALMGAALAPSAASAAPKSQTVEFTSQAPTAATVGGPSYHVTAAASSGLPVTLAIDPASGGVCTLSGSTVSFIGTGTCTIDATQPGSGGLGPGEYNEAYKPAQAQQSFSVTAPSVVVVERGPTPPAGPGTKPPLVNSNFVAGTSSFEAASGRVIFIETITNGGTFSWSLTVPNGKFGVIASNKASRSAKKCRGGLVRLGGRCRRSTIVFSEGSATVPAGVVIFKLRPSATAMKMLQSAFRHKHGVLVTATFTFQSSLGGSPVTHRQALLDKLKRK